MQGTKNFFAIWPIKRHELKKALPLIFLKFLISFVYCMLTCIKDTVVVTAHNSGAEIIPVIKSFLVLPISILVAIAYSKLSNKFRSQSLFYSIILGFIVILGLYGFLLYPNKDFFTPTHSANWLLDYFGDSYKHLVSVYTHWIHVLFFIVTELWGQVVIFLLYWGFTNNICSIEEAKRIYSILIAAGAVALLISGPIVSYYVRKYYSIGFVFTVKAVIVFSIVCALLAIITYWIMNNFLLSYKGANNAEKSMQNSEIFSKTNLSLIESLRHIFSSRYLMAIAVMVIGCGLGSNLVEVTWKAQLKNMYPSQEEYQLFMSRFNLVLGCLTLFILLIVSGNVLQFIGWLTSAKITPIAILISGTIFFIMSYFKGYFVPLANFMHIDSLKLIVLFGAFQNLVAKATKYAFFDSTKEIVFIPLDKESKTKGKAAIDLVGSRLGKSGSSFFQLLIMKLKGTSSVLLITPFIIPVFFLVIGLWYYAVVYLGKHLNSDQPN